MIIQLLLLSSILIPIACAISLGLLLWLRQGLIESLINRVVFVSFFCSIACIFTSLIFILLQPPDEHIEFAFTWFHLSSYHYSIGVTLDWMSASLALFSTILITLIGAFSRRYLHRDPGYFRFYFLLSLFGAGVEIILLSSCLDFLFIGWEMVGFTSAMLIAFFYERQKPVEHGLRAFFTYRFCDVGLLCAMIWLHHTGVGSDFDLSDSVSWHTLPAPSSASDLLFVGFCLMLAAMGKSAQMPFSGWLPRAMEGPTPSSAIFYGAISIHLGAFLLLRITPIIEASLILQLCIFLIGLFTAIHGNLSGRVQTDIKSALAYASLTQVGVIWVEIALGLYHLAIIHMVGHATMRSLQILKSPSLLHDHQHLEEAMGHLLPRTRARYEKFLPRKTQLWLYRLSLERGFTDAVIKYGLLEAGLNLLRKIDNIEARWFNYLNRAK